ncbi:hypothetical protein QYE76_062033 [Lolium multiflorum]|uniref:Uncharacterized protein n=1 Tax=Lolium multiflorum TaxID=4521 RepID=A0AAD8S394_LOLMU|nr:hypothetical protein QYE76_062033 [Lolium multiflorum]
MADQRKSTTPSTGIVPITTDKASARPPPPGYILMNKAMMEKTLESSSARAISSTDKEVAVLSKTTDQAIPGQRSGKELYKELGTAEERKAIVIDLSMARNTSRGRFLAVGIFLSVLAITSRSLIDSMKRVWKIHGHIDTLQLADRRFIPEFSEKGNFNHVVKGGPWRDTECRQTGGEKKKTYIADLSVPPITPEDGRTWFLPDHTGGPRQDPGAFWRPTPSKQHRDLATVAYVTDKVGTLVINDTPAAIDKLDSLSKIIIEPCSSPESSASPAGLTRPPPTTATALGTNTKARCPNQPASSKRRHRQHHQGKPASGGGRDRCQCHDQDEACWRWADLETSNKGLRELRELDEALGQKPDDCNPVVKALDTDHEPLLQAGNNQDGLQVDIGTEDRSVKEAASHGAAGQLTSAKERTGQEP